MYFWTYSQILMVVHCTRTLIYSLRVSVLCHLGACTYILVCGTFSRTEMPYTSSMWCWVMLNSIILDISRWNEIPSKHVSTARKIWLCMYCHTFFFKRASSLRAFSTRSFGIDLRWSNFWKIHGTSWGIWAWDSSIFSSDFKPFYRAQTCELLVASSESSILKATILVSIWKTWDMMATFSISRFLKHFRLDAWMSSSWPFWTSFNWQTKSLSAFLIHRVLYQRNHSFS